jgi:hypothetical protein
LIIGPSKVVISFFLILIGKFGCNAVIVGVLLPTDASIPADVAACGAPVAIAGHRH